MHVKTYEIPNAPSLKANYLLTCLSQDGSSLSFDDTTLPRLLPFHLGTLHGPAFSTEEVSSGGGFYDLRDLWILRYRQRNAVTKRICKLPLVTDIVDIEVSGDTVIIGGHRGGVVILDLSGIQ